MPDHQPLPPATRPVVTLTTDFGLDDWYVAAIKAVLLRQCPEVCIIDVTHRIPQGDILKGSIALERAISTFAAGAIHLVVVDPGVGTGRRILVAQFEKQMVVCPDNGLLTWALRRCADEVAIWELAWRPEGRTSSTFHGRDVMAPVAGILAARAAPLHTLARATSHWEMLDIRPADQIPGQAGIIHIDHFGNATTNVPAELLATVDDPVIRVKSRSLDLRHTYADVAAGQPVALIGSSDLLEIAVRNGSAARVLGLHVGDVLDIASAS